MTDEQLSLPASKEHVWSCTTQFALHRRSLDAGDSDREWVKEMKGNLQLQKRCKEHRKERRWCCVEAARARQWKEEEKRGRRWRLVVQQDRGRRAGVVWGGWGSDTLREQTEMYMGGEVALVAYWEWERGGITSSSLLMYSVLCVCVC